MVVGNDMDGCLDHYNNVCTAYYRTIDDWYHSGFDSKGIKIICLNIRSINRNLDEFLLFLFN